jgi:hypothetical protein
MRYDYYLFGEPLVVRFNLKSRSFPSPHHPPLRPNSVGPSSRPTVAGICSAPPTCRLWNTITTRNCCRISKFRRGSKFSTLFLPLACWAVRILPVASPSPRKAKQRLCSNLRLRCPSTLTVVSSTPLGAIATPLPKCRSCPATPNSSVWCHWPRELQLRLLLQCLLD